ncbi:MAG: hypothetical protein M3Q69_02350 [Acidobacteriota bacterium]|nr:hypothetical protein [Acidobacteriota bacterium]
MSENEVTVFFGGICTHIQPSVQGDIGRTVLVNAGNGMRLLDSNVPPHTAVLVIDPKYLDGPPPSDIPGLDPRRHEGAWVMDGVALQIANAVHTQRGPSYSPDWPAVPSLSAAVGGVKLVLDPRVVTNGGAACRFDVPSGAYEPFRASAHANAVWSKLTVTIREAAPTLVVTRIWDQAVSTIRLTPGASIALHNIGAESDAEVDFVLHYGVTTFTPNVLPHFEVPEGLRDATPDELARLQLPPAAGAQLTLGCSNSNYP